MKIEGNDWDSGINAGILGLMPEKGGRTLWKLMLTGLVVLFVCGTALADDEKEKGVNPRAQKRYMKAMEFEKHGLLEKAIEEYKKALAIQENVGWWWCLGNCYVQLGKEKQIGKAIKAFEKEILLHPDYRPPYFSMASIAEKKGLYNTAIGYLKKYVALSQDKRTNKGVKKRIEELKKKAKPKDPKPKGVAIEKIEDLLKKPKFNRKATRKKKIKILREISKKPFIKLAKGDFWEYEVMKGDKKASGKMEIDSVDKDGNFRVKTSGATIISPKGAMVWILGEHYLTWTWERWSSLKWRVLKFKGKKGNTWRFVLREGGGELDVVVESRVVTVEDVKTPAGKFKGCLKIRHTPAGLGGGKAFMWWAKGVGLVKVEVFEDGKLAARQTLTSYKVESGMTDERLKEMVEKADVVAWVSVPKECAGKEKVQVELSGTYKGEAKPEEGKIEITQPGKDSKVKPLKEGKFVVFLKKDDEKLILLHSPVPAKKELLDRITNLLKKAKQALEKFKELSKKAQIIASIKIIVVENKKGAEYYIAKVISTVKGTAEGEYLKVLILPGTELKKGKEYILFLVETEKSGHKMTKLADPVRGVFDHDEGLLKKLSEILKSSK